MAFWNIDPLLSIIIALAALAALLVITCILAVVIAVEEFSKN